MNPMIRVAIAWTARVLGWGTVLTFVAVVVWHYRGIALRAQVAHYFAARQHDAEDAEARLGEILALAQVPLEPGQVQSLDSCPSISGTPWAIVPARPVALRVASHSEKGRWVEYFAVFDGDGRPLDEAMVMNRRREGLAYGSASGLAEAAVGLLLAIREQGPAPDGSRPGASTSAMEARRTVVRVFQYAPAGKREVFRLICTHPAMLLHHSTMEGRPGVPAVLRLLTRDRRAGGQIGRWAVAAEWTWDDSAGCFVGPQEDPHGVWRIALNGGTPPQ